MEEKEEKSAANKRGKDKEREKSKTTTSKKHKKKQPVSEKVKGKARAHSVSILSCSSSLSFSSSSSSSSSNSSKKTFYFKKEHMPKVLQEVLRVNNNITFFINCYKILINRYLILILYSGRLFGNTMHYQKIISLN
jgi:hypothetical protein